MTSELYDFFNNLHLRINSKDLQRRYKSMQPVPYLVLDNFFPEKHAHLTSKIHRQIQHG